ncbi:MAG TPA: hypothetical protein VFC93_18810 [Chloroflexota bacterium]|nr:hypothetical protein [Chloroflexota bacterium]
MKETTTVADSAQQKKTWTAPTLVTYGSVVEITLGCNKDFGSSDGFLFQGNPIACRS